MASGSEPDQFFFLWADFHFYGVFDSLHDYGKQKLQKQKMITGFASVSALIALANPQYVDGNLVINSGYVGTGGMTVAMVMGLVIGWLFSAYFKTWSV